MGKPNAVRCREPMRAAREGEPRLLVFALDGVGAGECVRHWLVRRSRIWPPCSAVRCTLRRACTNTALRSTSGLIVAAGHSSHRPPSPSEGMVIRCASSRTARCTSGLPDPDWEAYSELDGRSDTLGVPEPERPRSPYVLFVSDHGNTASLADERYQAVLAYQGAFAHVYLADRST